MPVVFSEEDKKKIRATLFKEGFSRVKKHGFKKVLISEIAKDAGIAKGTFYNFFTSKEHFLFEMIRFNRQKNRKKAEHFFLNTCPGQEEVRQFFLDKYLQGDVSIAYIKREDMAWLFRKDPDKLDIFKNEALLFMDSIFNSIEEKSPNAQLNVVVNMMNIIADYVVNKDKYFETTFEETVTTLVNALVEYIFHS